jgi:predicted acyltransferase
MTTTFPRFTALDVFRGMTICLMIIVNSPGNYDTTYSPLLHANWHGFTPTDLVFPSFLFAIGNAMSFVMKKWGSMKQSQVLTKIFKRTFIIFILGFLMYWFPFVKVDSMNNISSFPIGETRILGVLQRIALCYFAASLMIWYLKPKMTLIISGIILFGYWILLYVFGDAGQELTLTGNATIKLDRWLMGESHMYHGEGIAFDPEGWLSTLPAIVNIIGGYFAGVWIQKKGSTYEAISKLLLIGFVLTFIGYLWDLSFPVNKKLWTSSFVMLTIGLDCILIAGLMYIIEFYKKKRWTNFFEIFGKNPLFIYVFSELLLITMLKIHMADSTTVFSWIYNHFFVYAGAYFGSFLYAISFMLFCWSIGWWMDKKKIYIRV